MNEGARERVLERGVAREVRLVVEPGETTPSVVKRFERKSLGGALLDRARAQREHDMLSELHAHGVAVPRPIELRRDGAAWEVRMQWLDGAESVERVLAGAAPWPVAPERAARALGRLLASLHAAGVDHPDLHAGNALLDGAGGAFAIDFHKSRRVRVLSARKLERDLVRLAAGVREQLGPRFRARFFWAWWRAIGPEQRASVSSAVQLALRAELAAREHRAEVVRARRKRWTRKSPACRRVESVAIDGVERADAPAGTAAELDLLAERHGAQRGELVCVLASGARVLLLVGRDWRVTRRSWWAAARLDEHGIAVARPLCISRAPRIWAAFELPDGAEPCASCADLRADRKRLRELGTLCAQLADRGLRPLADTAHPIWFDATGRPLLAALADVEFDARIACGIEPIRTLALAGIALGDLSQRERAAFAAGILRGVQLGRVDADRLRADLRHG